MVYSPFTRRFPCRQSPRETQAVLKPHGMGVDFRSGRYLRRVILGKRTVKEGEAAVVWSRNGRAREVIGPSIERLFYSTIRFLDRHTALPGQYLVVTFKDGTLEHMKGPVSLYENPILHTSIRACKALTLQSVTDCIVVVGRSLDSAKDSVFQRRIVTGPEKFIPAVNETVTFPVWTVASSELVKNYTQPQTNDSPIISTAPSTASFQIDLITSDGFKYKVQIAVRHRIVDVDAACQCDPIGEFWQALQRDFTTLGASYSSESTIETHTLSSLGQGGKLHGLYQASSSCGVEIMDVSICGVDRPADLVTTEANVKEATLKHEAEMEKAKRSAEVEREKASARLASADQRRLVMQAEFESSAHEAKLQQELEAVKQKRYLAIEAEAQVAKLESARQENQVLLEFLSQLKSMNVDLTKYLTTVTPGRKRVPSIMSAKHELAEQVSK